MLTKIRAVVVPGTAFYLLAAFKVPDVACTGEGIGGLFICAGKHSIRSWNHRKQIRTRPLRSKASTGARTSTVEAVATAARAARMRVANWGNEVSA